MSGLLVRAGATGPKSEHTSVKIACQGRTADWRVVVRGPKPREFRPCAFDARDQTVWVVCRPPPEPDALDCVVAVGDLQLVACDAAVVITAWSPEPFAPGLSTGWTGGALVPNSSRVTMPDPPIGAVVVKETALLPQGYGRNGEGCRSPHTSDSDESADESVSEDEGSDEYDDTFPIEEEEEGSSSAEEEPDEQPPDEPEANEEEEEEDDDEFEDL